MRTYRTWLVSLMSTYDEFNFNQVTINLFFAVAAEANARMMLKVGGPQHN